MSTYDQLHSYVNVPLDIVIAPDPSFSRGNDFAIAAVHISTAKRYLIKVSDLATREQLQKEVRRMNARPGMLFKYVLTQGGKEV